jgi:hypothetical protein
MSKLVWVAVTFLVLLIFPIPSSRSPPLGSDPSRQSLRRCLLYTGGLLQTPCVGLRLRGGSNAFDRDEGVAGLGGNMDARTAQDGLGRSANRGSYENVNLTACDGHQRNELATSGGRFERSERDSLHPRDQVTEKVWAVQLEANS